jgi:hypothetical protein
MFSIYGSIFVALNDISFVNVMVKKKVQKDKQQFTKHTYKTKDRATRTPLKTGDKPKYLYI